MTDNSNHSLKITVHAAASPRLCKEMETRYGWKLLRIRKSKGGNDVLPVDCIFEGEAEFPTYHKDD